MLFTGLQVLRFWAAAAVVVLHAVYHGNIAGIIKLDDLLRSPFNLLLLGVPIFFALSGFLLARVIEKGNVVRFVLHRIARIYPAFLIAVTLTMTVKALVLNKPLALSDPLGALSLLPIGRT